MIDTIVILASGQGLRMGNIGKAYANSFELSLNVNCYLVSIILDYFINI